MILSKNVLMLKTHSESWSLRRVRRSPIYIIENPYYVYTAKIFRILGRFKALLAMTILLIFQFSLYEFDCEKYFMGLY